MQATLSVKDALRKSIIAHKAEIMAARQAYHGRRNRAKFDPDVYGSIIIDAMDQVITN